MFLQTDTRSDEEIIRQLSNRGEVGAHDTRHDGKLAHLPKDQLLKRLSEARRDLSKILRKPVDGFRAPILQHSKLIFKQ